MSPAAPSASRGKVAPPTTALDPVVAKLTALGLDHPASCLPELVEQAARESLAPLAFLELVLSGELDRKDERRVTTMLKLSGLPPGKTLEEFDWSFQPRADRRQIEALATCAYLREKTNVLFLGPPGVGKSHLAVALG
jgi:DNA replication protein DnaC